MLELLAAGGGGAIIGGAVAKALELFASRHTREADAAKALTEATVDFTRAVSELNKNLHQEIILLKRAIITLTDAVDAIIPHIQGLTEEQKYRLIEANTAAKLVL